MQEVIAALVQDGLAFKKGSRDKQQQQGSGKASETEALMKGVAYICFCLYICILKFMS